MSSRNRQDLQVNYTKFFRDWFELLESEAPRKGAFTMMLFFALGAAEQLGRTQLEYLVQDAAEIWDRWPDRAFEEPCSNTFRAPMSLEQIFEAFGTEEFRRVFPLFDILPTDLILRWQENLGYRLAHRQGASDEPDADARGWANAHDRERFVELLRQVDDVERLLFGIEVTMGHREFCSSGHVSVLQDLELAMLHRLEVLAREGHRVVLPSNHVESVLERPNLDQWLFLFDVLAGVEIDSADLYARYAMFSGAAAPISELSLTGATFVSVAMTPALEKLGLVDCEEKALSTFFVCKREVPELRELAIQGGEVAGSKVVEEISTGGAFSKLERLSLRGLDLDDSALEMLGESSFQWLRGLDLTDNPKISGKGLSALFSHWKFSEIEALCLDSNPADRILAIGDATYSSSLRSLTARKCSVNPEVVSELSHMTGFESLEALDLSNNALGVEGATAIAAWPRLRRLTSLILQNASVRGEGARMIANSVSLQKLEHLDLYHNQLGPAGIRALAEGRLKNLRALDIALNELDLGSLRKLLTAPVLSNLEYLCLGWNLDGSILKVILEESELFRLEKLVVFVSDLQPEHIDAFLRPSSMPNLEQVHIYARRSSLASKSFGIPLIPLVEVYPIEQGAERITHSPGTSMGPLRELFVQASRA